MKRTEFARKTPMSRGAAPAAKKPTAEPKRRTRKCAITDCRKPFEPRNMTHKVCGPDCAEKLVALEQKRADRKALMAFREKNKKKGVFVAAAQKAFNAFIRARDAGLPCICCGMPLGEGEIGGAYDAGHYRSVGSAAHMRFVEDNVHAQRKYCNKRLAGNAVEYRKGLIARIGIERVEAVECDNAARHYSKDDLVAIRSHYDKRLKELRVTSAQQMIAA